uniref:Transposase n=1 Tax=Parastrongyloides trichosuri TaxID=131310 RepID=A0A0N5A3L5_PARTI
LSLQSTTGINHEQITVNNSFAVCHNLAHLNYNLKTPQYHNATAR